MSNRILKIPVTACPELLGRILVGASVFLVFVALLFTPVYSQAAPSKRLASNDAYAGESGYYVGNDNGARQPLILKSIAILPLENLSGTPMAPNIVRDYLKKELKGKGWVLITRDEAVEEYLASKRIRYTGAITRLAVREMGKLLGVDAVMVGSVNYYTGDGARVVVGLSCRLISTRDGSIIWANNMTYTGRDFEGFLGMGAVKSLDILASMVVKDLVTSIADRFFIRETALSPFEIERVITYPSIGKAGEVIELRVKIVPLNESPQQVRAHVHGEEVILEKVGEQEYRGLVYAPDTEGEYMVDIVAMDRAMVPFSFDAAGKLVVDSTPPIIDVSIDNKIFSSRGRGSVTIDTRLMGIDVIDEWKFAIYDEDGSMIRSDRGFGVLPPKLLWRGETDRKSLVDDGWYTCELTVRDVAGNETVVSRVVRVKNSVPEIKVDVDLLDDIVLFSFEYAPDEPIESWTLIIHDRDGTTYKTIEGDGPVPDKVEYPVEEGVKLSKMAFSIRATDAAGNEFRMTKTLPSYFNRKIPFAGLKEGNYLPVDF